MKLNTWDDVEIYLHDHAINFSFGMLGHAASGDYPRDAYSLGQLASKAWLMRELTHIPKGDIAILGVWIGTLVDPLMIKFHPPHIYGFDEDPEAIAMSERLNNMYVRDNWRYKGVVADVNMLDFSDLEFETSSELVRSSVGTIINTSCEHMTTEWYNSVTTKQLVVLQTNNNPNLPGHVNTCDSIEEMKRKYPMDYIAYEGTMELPIYKRHMLIGYPQ